MSAPTIGRTRNRERNRGQSRERGQERGSMAIEMVILAPVMIMFVMIVVAFGRYVAVRGDVEAASRDAVRAASLERSGDSADSAATQTAEDSLNGRWSCTTANRNGDFESGQTISITLSCQVPWNDLGLIGLKSTKTVTATSEAPLDLYRRAGS